MAKTQQNTVLGVRKPLIDNITLVLSPLRFLSHTHTLGYNLTFQKRVSGFKTHQTAKEIHVWIVLFDLMTYMNEHYNVLHEE